jgi:hypothetical protein
MSKGFGEKERAFVADLQQDTGRDLAHWMAEVTARELAHRNEIIDWLRQQGFTFARASWLERIHHNGGRLIYGDVGDTAPVVANRKRPEQVPAPPLRARELKPVARAVPAPASLPPASDEAIDTLLLAAKAYRPLAQALLRDILAAVPGADARAANGLIVFSHEAPFAAVAASARDVRLYLQMSEATAARLAMAASNGWQRAKPTAGLDAALTHMLIVTDARQLTRDLSDLVVASSRDCG